MSASLSAARPCSSSGLMYIQFHVVVVVVGLTVCVVVSCCVA